MTEPEIAAFVGVVGSLSLLLQEKRKTETIVTRGKRIFFINKSFL
jgi:hypothetical protein